MERPECSGQKGEEPGTATTYISGLSLVPLSIHSGKIHPLQSKLFVTDSPHNAITK